MPLASCFRATKNFAAFRAGKSPAILICSTISIAAALIFAIALAAAPRGNSDKDAAARAQAQALFQKALAVSDIRAPGSPSFELQGTIEIHESGGKEPQGTYDLKWAAPDKWREEIHFTNYSRIRVGSKDGYFQSRSIPYEIEPILEITQALYFAQQLHVWARPTQIADLRGVKIRKGKVQGQKADCASLTLPDQNYGPDYCFDSDSGLLLKLTGWGPLGQGGPEGEAEYSKFVALEKRQFPGSIEVRQDMGASASFQVTSLTALMNINQAEFQPPPDAITWPSCDNPDQMPQIDLRYQSHPRFPPAAMQAHIQGTVVVYGVVTADGHLQNLKALAAPSPVLADAAIAALNNWRYQPETCHGTPVPVETIVTTIFTIGG